MRRVDVRDCAGDCNLSRFYSLTEPFHQEVSPQKETSRISINGPGLELLLYCGVSYTWTCEH
jgi:hypothetical protein